MIYCSSSTFTSSSSSSSHPRQVHVPQILFSDRASLRHISISRVFNLMISSSKLATTTTEDEWTKKRISISPHMNTRQRIPWRLEIPPRASSSPLIENHLWASGNSPPPAQEASQLPHVITASRITHMDEFWCTNGVAPNHPQVKIRSKSSRPSFIVNLHRGLIKGIVTIGTT